MAAFLDLTDSPGSYVNAAKRKVAVKADGTGVEFVAGLLDHEAADAAETRAGLLATKAVTPVGLKAMVDDLLNGAPGALDTLNELADALGDDPNFSATITALINQRLTQDQVDARIRTIGGVGSPTFFSLANDLDLNVGDNLVLGGNVGPVAAGRTVGLIVSAAMASGGGIVRVKLQRGTADLVELERFGAHTGAPIWYEYLLLDKPTAGIRNYSMRAHVSAAAKMGRGTSLTAFVLPEGVASDVISADEALAAGGDVLSVTITPPSATSKIMLRFRLDLSADSGVVLALRRGSDVLVSPHRPGGGAIAPKFAAFSHWVDAPATTDPVTYSLRCTTAVGNIRKGSYLLAQPL